MSTNGCPLVLVSFNTKFTRAKTGARQSTYVKTSISSIPPQYSLDVLVQRIAQFVGGEGSGVFLTGSGDAAPHAQPPAYSTPATVHDAFALWHAHAQFSCVLFGLLRHAQCASAFPFSSWKHLKLLGDCGGGGYRRLHSIKRR